MKFIFMGTPDFSVPILERLNKLGEVDLVVSQEDKRKGRGKKFTKTPVKVKAEELGLEVYQPADVNSPEAIDKLRHVEADIIVVVAYGQILSQEIIDLPKKYIVNVHASLLPYLRGAAPINRVIMEGHSKTGVSLMKVEEGLDAGPVSAVKEMEIGEMNAGELEDKLSHMGADLLEEFVLDASKGQVEFIEQNEDKKTYASKILKNDLDLDFNDTSANIVNKIRGLSPHYGVRFKYDDKFYKIYKAEELEDKNDLEAGRIIKSDK